MSLATMSPSRHLVFSLLFCHQINTNISNGFTTKRHPAKLIKTFITSLQSINSTKISFQTKDRLQTMRYKLINLVYRCANFALKCEYCFSWYVTVEWRSLVKKGERRQSWFMIYKNMWSERQQQSRHLQLLGQSATD